MLQAHGVCIGRKSLGILNDAVGESGREEQNLNVLGQHTVPSCQRGAHVREFVLDVLLDLHALLAHTLLIQHAVGLVYNEHLQLAGVELAAADGVQDGTRRTNHDGAPNSGSAVDSTGDSSLDNEFRNELSNSLDDILDLTSELTSGGQQQGLRLLWPSVIDPRQNGNNKSGRLSSTRLRLGNHVTGRAGEQHGQCLLLDLGGLLEVHGYKTLVNTLGAAGLSVILAASAREARLISKREHLQLQILEGLGGRQRVVGVLVEVGDGDLDIIAGLVKVGLIVVGLIVVGLLEVGVNLFSPARHDG